MLMHIELTSKGPDISSSQLAEFEERTGQRIPNPYRRFLLDHNGGRPRLSVFKFQGRRGRMEESAVDGFFGVHTQEGYGLELCLETLRGRIPEDLFPIASDHCGNLVLMGSRGPRAEKIYFWDHELEGPDDEPPTEGNVYFIADSLDDFLNGLTELEVASQ